MQELKVQCDCGQRFKFDVEPVSGRMPFTVNCPVCGADGTEKANALLAQVPAAPAAAPHPAAVVPRLRISVAGPSASTSALVASEPPPVQTAPHARPASTRPVAARPPATVSNSLLLGTVGAFLGAALGVGLMYGFFALTDFRFPLLGVGIGALTGLGARILYRGTDNSLGGISAAIAAVSVVTTLYLMYGEFPIISIISVIVSVSVAYRVAS